MPRRTSGGGLRLGGGGRRDGSTDRDGGGVGAVRRGGRRGRSGRLAGRVRLGRRAVPDLQVPLDGVPDDEGGGDHAEEESDPAVRQVEDDRAGLLLAVGAQAVHGARDRVTESVDEAPEGEPRGGGEDQALERDTLLDAGLRLDDAAELAVLRDKAVVDDRGDLRDAGPELGDRAVVAVNGVETRAVAGAGRPEFLDGGRVLVDEPASLREGVHDLFELGPVGVQGGEDAAHERRVTQFVLVASRQDQANLLRREAGRSSRQAEVKAVAHALLELDELGAQHVQVLVVLSNTLAQRGDEPQVAVVATPVHTVGDAEAPLGGSELLGERRDGCRRPVVGRVKVCHSRVGAVETLHQFGGGDTGTRRSAVTTRARDRTVGAVASVLCHGAFPLLPW